jgi:hypothetical protein
MRNGSKVVDERLQPRRRSLFVLPPIPPAINDNLAMPFAFAQSQFAVRTVSEFAYVIVELLPFLMFFASGLVICILSCFVLDHRTVVQDL